MLSFVFAVFLLAQDAPPAGPDEIAEILALCTGADLAECSAQETIVDLYFVDKTFDWDRSESLVFCRSNRATAAQLVDTTLRRVIQDANFTIRYNDATETLIAFVAQGALPTIRYRLKADLSGVPVVHGSRERCRLRMQSIRFLRDDQGRWRPGQQDTFMQHVNNEIHSAAALVSD